MRLPWGIPKFFRGDSAFAGPKLLRLLEKEGYRYAIRLSAGCGWRVPRGEVRVILQCGLTSSLCVCSALRGPISDDKPRTSVWCGRLRPRRDG
jgi:hypothetical protein